MERDPGSTRRGVEQRIQDGPVRDCVRSISHSFCFAKRRGDRSGVQVIAPDHDRRRQLAAANQLVQCDAEPGALTLSQPTDPRWQTLEGDALLCESDPAAEMRVIRKELEDQLIGAMQVSWLARERDPAKGALPFAEQGPDVLGHEARNGEGIGNAGVAGLGANVVAVIEYDRASRL